MRFFVPFPFLVAMIAVACTPSEAPPTAPGAAPEPAAASSETPATAPTEATERAETPPAPTAAGEIAPDTFADGTYTSPRFNVRFQLPAGWRVDTSSTGPGGLGTSDDSVTLLGPPESDLRMVVANSDSLQLVDSSFDNLTETLSFENVRIHPDRSAQRTFNGVPGYRTEADALLRGDAVPVYLIAQAMELPGAPTMATIFVPADKYYLHSDAMFAILDSIQALNLRGN